MIRRVSLGELGRAAQLLGQAKVAAPSPEVRDELQSLLVTLAAERGLLPADHSSDEEVPARDLATALRKAPRSSGAGPSGSRFTHWQACQLSASSVAALGQVVNLVASGRVPTRREPPQHWPSIASRLCERRTAGFARWPPEKRCDD